MTGTTSPMAAIPSWLRQGVTLSYLVLLLLFALSALLNPSYASWTNIQNLLQIGAFIGIIAVGQTLLIITGQIDLSVPWTLTSCAIIMTTLFTHGHDIGIAIAATLGCGLVIGLFN